MAAPFVNGNVYVKVGATGTLIAMTRECQSCCKGKGFYENCVKPIADIISQGVKPHNDPAFNDKYDDHLNNNKTGNWLPGSSGYFKRIKFHE